ncbi:PASTA domain-containing protein [Streptomyces sp. NPDC005648]|uniref:PASTA domain-containing protein n=1 Tax=Streptomyces sp. NPDC005648 TaxID=3157044 RepID=UPI0033B1F9CE
MRRIAVLLVLVLAVGACGRSTPLTLVKAVAAGVPSLAPFFDEKSGIGHDQAVRTQAVHGSLQQGDTPGLYGGTRRPTVCDVRKLKAFLTDPRNHRKAQAWATALNLTTDQIPGYLDRLTPVLLRHDTLVQNHDYKKGKAVPFDSLLQAGIAILVDEQGLPAVKCSCGNPLRPFAGDTNRISVKFEHGNRQWKGFERSSVVAVRPAPRTLRRLALVDVDDSRRGIDRPVGTTGTHDTTFNAARPLVVPDLTGATFARASRLLTDKGLAAGYAGKALPPDDARVTASDPDAGTELRFGQYVTLSTAGGTSAGTTGGGTSGGPSGGTIAPPASSSSSSSSGTSKAPPSSSAPSSVSPSTPSSGTSSGSGPSSSGPSSSGPSTAGPSTAGPSSGGPSSSAHSSSAPPPSSAKPPSSAAPPTTVAPPTSHPATSSAAPPPSSAPVTTSAPPPPSAPVTRSAPPPETTSAPASGEPASSGPASSAFM